MVAVAGTATDVGKTWVTDRLVRALRAGGHRVAARKPVQSFDPATRGPTDAEVLGAASGEDPHAVCPPQRWYPLALAPPMAVDRLRPGSTLHLAELVAELDWGPDVPSVGVLETVGGVRSPVSHDADSAALARAVRPDLVVLVADAGLGTINAVRCALPALDGIAARVEVVLNRFDAADPLHRDNLAWLRDRDGVAATAVTGAWCEHLVELVRAGGPTAP